MVGKKKIELDNQKIYQLRENGFTYEEITGWVLKQGISVSVDVIRQRCKTIYRLKNKLEPTRMLANKNKARKGYKKIAKVYREISKIKATNNEEEIKAQILKLKETKGATDKQLEQIAQLYGINLENKTDKNNDERY